MTLAHEPLNALRPPGPSCNPIILKAYLFAQEAHKDHRRATGEPYFNHLVGTANLLVELGMGPVTIAAGLLHDSIEDVDVKPETIENEFGKEIRFLVEGVTKLGRLHYSGAERYTESLRKLFVAISKDVRVLIIKLADRLQNMQGLEFLPKEKRDRIALETLEIYAPLAYRLGIRKINRELEDLAFPFVFPKEHERVRAELKAKHKENIHNLEKFHKSVLQQLEKDGIHNTNTGYRIKGLYSLYRKLKRRDWDIEKIHDIAALRIIVPNVVDCYRVLGSVHGHWRPLPGQIKDYIAMPKPSNYRGIHTTIFTGDGSIVEVQIRTEEMHRKTEYGMHFEYKETVDNPRANLSRVSWVTKFFPNFIQKNKEVHSDLEQRPEKIPDWIHALGEYNKEAQRNDTFFENLKSDFFSDRVFVFTPKGDVLDLPAGSTPIDFAYTLHSGIGNTMSGVKINNKLVSLSTELENGDIIEIMTKPSSHPSTKWLEIAKTSIAKKHIKIALERARTK